MIQSALILDESEPNVVFWEGVLREFDVQKVTTYRSGGDAIAQCDVKSPDLIIASWDLGAMPGRIFLQKVLSVPARRNIPCFFYAKNFTSEDFLLTEELNLKNFIKMPFDHEKTSEMVKQVLEFENNLPRAEYLLRQIENLMMQFKANDAVRIFDKSLVTPGKNFARAITLHGEIQFSLGLRDNALTSYKEAIAADPKYLPARYALTRFYSLTTKHEQAISNAQSIVHSNTKNFFALLNLSSAFIHADHVENAKMTLQMITDMDPENRQVDDELGKIALKEGNFDLAAQLLSDTQNGDEIARFYNSMGISYVAKGQHERGIATYKNAIKVLSSKAKMHLIKFNLALALKKKGDLVESFQAFCESYIADPAFEKAYSNIALTAKEFASKGLIMDQSLVDEVKEARRQFQAEIAGKLNKIS